MVRYLRAGAAAMVIVLLTAGVPTALVVLIGNPLAGIAWSGPISDQMILALVCVLVWLFWAQTVLALVAEAINQTRGRRGRPHHVAVPTLGGQQRLARMLIAALLAAGTAGTAIAGPALAGVGAAAATPVIHPVTDQPSHHAPTGIAHQGWHDQHEQSQHARGQMVTVQRGDTLWSLAEHYLGSGERWRAIAEANHGRDLGDGTHASAQSLRTHLQPGSLLLIPTTPQPGHSSEAAVVVEPGDTLSGIAQADLGDASRWPGLYQANQRIVGRDPDLIVPGEVLHLPGTGHEADSAVRSLRQHRGPHDRGELQPPHSATRPGSTTADQAPGDHRTGTVPAAGARDGSRAGVSSEATTSTEAGNESTPVSPSSSVSPKQVEHVASFSALRALLATASCLAAGTLALVLLNRRRQHRERRPGRTIAANPAPLVQVERAVHETGAQAQPEVEFLDLALRHLAASRRVLGLPLPQLGAAVIGSGQLTVLFTDPVPGKAPEGWQAIEEGIAWRLPRATVLGEELREQPAPYPALVSIGQDETGGTWLLDLETIGVCAISGDRDQACQLIRFVVAELAVNAWSEGGQVLLTDGFATEATALNPARLCPVGAGEATRRGLAAADAADSPQANLGKDLLELRRDDEATDSTGPLVIVAPGGPDPNLVAALNAQARSRVVLICHQAADAVQATQPPSQPAQPVAPPAVLLRADGTARLPRWGIEVTAFGLSATEAEAMAALVAATSNTDDTAMPPAVDTTPAAAYSSVDGALRPEYTAPRDTDGDDASSMLPGADDAYLHAGATTAEDLAALAPGVREDVRGRVLQLDPDLDQDLADWFDQASTRPKIQVLGPVAVSGAGADLDTFDNRGGIVEFIVYLACQDSGVTVERATEMLCWAKGTVQNRAGQARRLLGVRPDGQDWLPEATKSTGARQRGIATYELHPERLVDADLFRRLRTRAQALGAPGHADLTTALSLVTGEPFDQLRRGGYGWLLEGDRLDHHMTAAITDVAHLLVNRALAEGDLARAHWAAEVAIKANPNSDIPRLDLAAISHAENGSATADQVVTDQVIDRVDADPTGRTEQVLDQRRWLAS